MVVVKGKANIPDALVLDKWDVVTIQQCSHFSWRPETYHPFGDSLVADLSLAWIAAGAKREGLRLRKGVSTSQKIDVSKTVLHDEHSLASNLWGAFDRVKRKFSGLRLHRAFKKLSFLPTKGE